ncbi:unnamed protein product, partial [marine sediment metagenome]
LAVIFFHKLLPKAEFVALRDSDSLEYLKSKGIYNKDMDFRPDSTFFFPGEDPEWVEEFLSKHGLKEKQFITLTIRTSIQGYITKQREADHMACLRLFLDKWVSQIDLPVLLCPEVRSEIQPMYDLIYSKLSSELQSKCIWMDHFWTTEQAKAVYQKARIVISMEMHSVILALSVGTPILHPRFMEAGRKAWMLRDMDLEDWLFDIDHMAPEELFVAATNIHRQYEASLNRVRKQMTRLKQ